MRYQLRIASGLLASNSRVRSYASTSATRKGASAPKQTGPNIGALLPLGAVGAAGIYYSQYGLALPDILGSSEPTVSIKPVVAAKEAALAQKLDKVQQTPGKVQEKQDKAQQSASSSASVHPPAEEVKTLEDKEVFRAEHLEGKATMEKMLNQGADIGVVREADKVQSADDVDELLRRYVNQTETARENVAATENLESRGDGVDDASSVPQERINSSDAEDSRIAQIDELRTQMRAAFSEELRAALEDQERHIRQKFETELARERDAYELALEREREDFLLDQNALKAEISSFNHIMETQNSQFTVYQEHRSLVNALLTIEKQIKNGDETNFDRVEDRYIRDVCELMGEPRGVVFEDRNECVTSFQNSIRTWMIAAFTSDDTMQTWLRAQILGRLYIPNRRFVRLFMDDGEADVLKGVSTLQAALENVKRGNFFEALLSLEVLEGTTPLLDYVKPWVVKARRSLLLHMQLDILRAQVACLHVTSLQEQ